MRTRRHRNYFDRRELRAFGILVRGGQITRLNDKMFSVNSQSTGTQYRVESNSGKWLCNCPDFIKNARPCKHVHAVNFLLRLPQIILSNQYDTSAMLGLPKYSESDRI